MRLEREFDSFICLKCLVFLVEWILSVSDFASSILENWELDLITYIIFKEYIEIYESV